MVTGEPARPQWGSGARCPPGRGSLPPKTAGLPRLKIRFLSVVHPNTRLASLLTGSVRDGRGAEPAALGSLWAQPRHPGVSRLVARFHRPRRLPMPLSDIRTGNRRLPAWVDNRRSRTLDPPGSRPARLKTRPA